MGHIVGLGLGYPEPYKHVPIVHLNQGLGMGVHANPDYLHSGVLVPFTGGKAWVEDGVQSTQPFECWRLWREDSCDSAYQYV